MSGERRAWLDACPGERRGVITLDGRPEHLLIEREGEAPYPRLGQRWSVRLGARSPSQREAFVDLGEGTSGVLRLTPDTRLPEGMLLDAEVAAEPQAGKAARFRLLGPSGEPRPGLRMSAPSLERQLGALAPECEIECGAEARETADLAQESALARSHTLKGGVTLTIETTRAMTVVDVNARTPGERDGRTQDANLDAIHHSARLLRLKSLGGTAAIDLIGFPRAVARMMAEANRSFADDGPEVLLLPPNRLGVLMLSRPRRRRPLSETLLDADGGLSARTLAQQLVRDLEREGRADPGALLRAVCAPDVAAALKPLAAALGPRFGVIAAPGTLRERAHIQRA